MLGWERVLCVYAEKLTRRRKSRVLKGGEGESLAKHETAAVQPTAWVTAAAPSPSMQPAGIGFRSGGGGMHTHLPMALDPLEAIVVRSMRVPSVLDSLAEPTHLIRKQDEWVAEGRMGG